MMDLPPPAYIQIAQAEAPPEAPAAEPTPIKVDVSQYVPDNAVAVTMIVSLTPPTGAAVIYAPGYEKYGSISFEIQYTNYRLS